MTDDTISEALVHEVIAGSSDLESQEHEGSEYTIDPKLIIVISPVLEKRVVRKMDLHLIPPILVAFLDRSNIGNANTAGLWLLTIYYIPYILFEWLALMWKAIPPHIWAFCCILVWGLASSLQAAAFTWSSLLAARFFLAVAEAGFAPGVPYLLSFFFKRNELGVRCGLYLSTAPLATTFAGALASSRYCQYVPDSADSARFLTEEEKQVAKARAVQQTGLEGKARVGSIDLKEALASLMDFKTWLPPLMYFSCNVSYSSLPVFTPTIIEDLGFAAINAQGLSAPPLLHFIPRTQQRAYMITGLSMIGSIGYILLATSQSTGVRYFASCFAAGGVFPAISNVLPWLMNNQGSDSKGGAAVALCNIIGLAGPLLGNSVFPAADKPYYVKGTSICAAFIFFNALLAHTLWWYLARENRAFEKRNSDARLINNDSKDHLVGAENDGYGFRNVL
ncbi:major facilitator superfamily transporter [Xylariaceae sp. FL0255]|nr:major facilitator superfamily transporter [Xylariaceae sp. FL0255]